MRITPKAALSYITNKFIYARLKKKNITIGKGVKINKKPIIIISNVYNKTKPSYTTNTSNGYNWIIIRLKIDNLRNNSTNLEI